MSLAAKLSHFVAPALDRQSGAALKKAVAAGTSKVERQLESTLVLSTKKAVQPAPDQVVQAILKSRPKQFKDLGAFKSYATALTDFMVGLNGKIKRALNKSARMETVHKVEKSNLYKPYMAAYEQHHHVVSNFNVQAQPLLKQAQSAGGASAELAAKYQSLLEHVTKTADAGIKAAEVTLESKLVPLENKLFASREQVRKLEDPFYAAQNEFFGLRSRITAEHTAGWEHFDLIEAGVHWSEQYRRISPKG